MKKVTRIFPGEINSLIGWMEQNFHDIDSYVISFKMKDNTTTTVYHIDTYLEGLGLSEISKDTIERLAYDEKLVLKGDK